GHGQPCFAESQVQHLLSGGLLRLKSFVDGQSGRMHRHALPLGMQLNVSVSDVTQFQLHMLPGVVWWCRSPAAECVRGTPAAGALSPKPRRSAETTVHAPLSGRSVVASDVWAEYSPFHVLDSRWPFTGTDESLASEVRMLPRSQLHSPAVRPIPETG